MSAPLPRRKNALRREVERLRDTKGVYCCRRCDHLIPVGWRHIVLQPGAHCVVQPASNRASS